MLLRQFLTLPLIPAAIAIAPFAQAQNSTNEATASALFDEGRRLMEVGQFASACPKFADSAKLDPGVGTMLNLAICYEKIGKTASAWATYRNAAASARDKGQKEREKIARDGVERLAKGLFRVVISVASQFNVDAVTVNLDGAPLPKSLWGLPAPVDPGAHTLEAVAPHKARWSTSFKALATTVPALVVPALVDELPTASTVAVRTSAAAPTVTPSEVPPPSGQRIAGLVVGGAGIVGVAVGSIFGLLAKSANDDSTAHCGTKYCDATGTDDRSSASSKATISTVAFVLGGVGLAGGAALWLTAPGTTKEHGAPVAMRLEPHMSASGGGVSLSGSW